MRKTFLAASLAVIVAFGLAAPANAAAHDSRPANKAANWIGHQLKSGVITYSSSFGAYADDGSSIDAALSLVAVGGHTREVHQIRNGIAKQLGNYISGAAFGDAGSTYAGPTAKAAVLAQISGGRAKSFGGQNLIKRLRARVLTSGPSKGRIADKSTYGDYANVLGQAFAARALARAGAPEATSVRNFLLEQQCSAGYFRTYFKTDPKASGQSCNAGRSAHQSTPDPDATATAVLMLLPQRHTRKVGAAIAKAGRWLAHHQNANGSFGGGSGTTTPNTNSTGLAGLALGELGYTARAQHAAVWVRRLQAHEAAGCSDGLSHRTGAIAYDAASFRAGLRDGVGSKTKGQWAKATAQALGVLGFAPKARGALRLDPSAHKVKAGARVVVRGIAPGDTICVRAGGAALRAVAPFSGIARTTVPVPAGKHQVKVVVVDSAGRRTARLLRIG